MDEVAGSSLDDALIAFLIDKLDLLLRSLELYDITGSAGISAMCENMVGSLILRGRNTYQQTMANPVGEKVWTHLNKIAILTTLVQAGWKLLDVSKDLFLPKSFP